VQVVAGVTGLRQLLGRDLQLARRLLDEGAGAAAAGRLHVHLLALAGAAGREEQRLHVLAADLGDEVHVSVQLLDGRRDRHHFLHRLAAEQRCQHAGPGAGEEDAIASGAEAALVLDPAEKLEHHLGLLGLMALVVLPPHGAVLRDGRLDGGRANVESDGQHHRSPEARCSAKLAAVPATPQRGTL
jgi:hypothetical protein